jgi:dodecin
MAESVYNVVELVGTSSESWEKAANAAVERAAKSLRDLRVAEVVEQDLVIEKEGYGLSHQAEALLQIRRWRVTRTSLWIVKRAGTALGMIRKGHRLMCLPKTIFGLITLTKEEHDEGRTQSLRLA